MPNILLRTIRLGIVVVLGIMASAVFLFPPTFLQVRSQEIPTFTQSEIPGD